MLIEEVLGVHFLNMRKLYQKKVEMFAGLFRKVVIFWNYFNSKQI